jgi:hypothetical protein
MRSAACSSRPYCACRKEGITNKVLAKMSVEHLKSIGLNLGDAVLVKDAIDALAAPPSPAVHKGGSDAGSPASAASSKGGGSVATAAVGMSSLSLSPSSLPAAAPPLPRTLLSSNFRREHAAAECPELQHQLFSSMHSLIGDMCTLHKQPAAAGKELFVRLQGESFENPKELLSEIQVAASRIWTSTQKLQGAGVDKAFNVEFCSLLNRALRDDDAQLMPHLVVIVRAINALCIVRRESASLKFPPNAMSHRGGALPQQHHHFFTVGKKYRVPMYLATSFSEDKAYEFWCLALCFPPLFRRPPHLWSGTGSLPQVKCQCTGSSTSTRAGSTRCATAART